MADLRVLSDNDILTEIRAWHHLRGLVDPYGLPALLVLIFRERFSEFKDKVLDMGKCLPRVGELAEKIRSLGMGKVIKINDLCLFFFHNNSPICHLVRQHLFTAGLPRTFLINFSANGCTLKQNCCYFL